jgi:ubiquinone/menaquinone biosynthesis C-methylase UbiE
MVDPRPVPPRSSLELALEWDAIAAVRATQLEKGWDVSYDRVLMPTIINLLDIRGTDSLLDVGCGTGVLTAAVAQLVGRVAAVDPSPESIRLAQRHALGAGIEQRISWSTGTVEGFAASSTEKFDHVLANMTLMDVAHLQTALAAISRLSRPGTTLVASITHPWFWPRYWGYENAPWFRYGDETFVEAEFKISGHSTGLLATHVHRPLEQYASALIRNGFAIEQIGEPFPDDEAMGLYAEPWSFPRFLVLKCVKRASDSPRR